MARGRVRVSREMLARALFDGQVEVTEVGMAPDGWAMLTIQGDGVPGAANDGTPPELMVAITVRSVPVPPTFEFTLPKEGS